MSIENIEKIEENKKIPKKILEILYRLLVLL